MASTSEDLQSLTEAVHDYRMVALAAAGALAWVAYDFCLTFQQEVSCVWITKWTAVKCLHLFLRYYTLFTLSINIAVTTNTKIPLGFCTNWFWYIGFNGPLLSTSIGNTLLLLRVNVYCEFDRRIIAFTSLLWFAETISTIVTVSLMVGSIDVLPRPPLFPIPGCIASPPKHIERSLVSWVLTLIIGCIYFIITLWRFLKARRYPISRESLPPNNQQGLRRHRTEIPLILLLLRDGASYFFLAFVVQLLNMVFIVVLASRPLQQMGTAWIMATFSILSNRILFNIHQAAAADPNADISDLVDALTFPRVPLELSESSTSSVRV